MYSFKFDKDDLSQMESRGMSPEKVLSQIEAFERGFPYSRLIRPCTIGDGIRRLTEVELERLEKTYSNATQSGRTMKFVPASGAATRMFRELISINSRYPEIAENDIVSEAEKGDASHMAFLEFIRGIRDFAFYDSLKNSMSKHGLNIDELLSKGHYKEIAEYALTPRGINLSYLPKGLIEFHRYPDSSRTSFEEHLVEGRAYTKDNRGNIPIHFTISPEHEGLFQSHKKKALKRFEGKGEKFRISFSIQSPSTDTIAVDMGNRPLRDTDGKLLFRPGGHGALLENVSNIGGDIVFIKNIDNVVPDRLKPTTYLFKGALGGHLLELQDKIFSYLRMLNNGDVNASLVGEIIDYAKERLSLVLPVDIANGNLDKKIDFLISHLNRPLRVCGMVKNEGEPGGGPFWVQERKGGATLQIVESSQVDITSPDQKKIWESSTHFNPVDLVCGVRDYLGNSFNLMDFMDPDTGFISVKSKDGRDIKALEHPGLWNGSMAHWNTVFVEVPIITFNPVKSVLDLLRKEHQPG